VISSLKFINKGHSSNSLANANKVFKGIDSRAFDWFKEVYVVFNRYVNRDLKVDSCFWKYCWNSSVSSFCFISRLKSLSFFICSEFFSRILGRIFSLKALTFAFSSSGSFEDFSLVSLRTLTISPNLAFCFFFHKIENLLKFY